MYSIFMDIVVFYAKILVLNIVIEPKIVFVIEKNFAIKILMFSEKFNAMNALGLVWTE